MVPSKFNFIEIPYDCDEVILQESLAFYYVKINLIIKN